ncbi:hypothetical protein GCM10027343_40640 [Noviherbaspirillum agri]
MWLLKRIDAIERVIANQPLTNDHVLATELRHYIYGIQAMHRYNSTVASFNEVLATAGKDKEHNERMKKIIPVYTPLSEMWGMPYGQAFKRIKKYLQSNPSELNTDAALVIISTFEKK